MAIEREEREACAREEGYWELAHRSGEGKKSACLGGTRRVGGERKLNFRTSSSH